jgi:Uma2 family endonuclease
MALAAKKKEMSVEEYLAFEEKSKYKHEYFEGDVFQMAGGKRQHSLTISNINFELQSQLPKKAKNCEVHGSDLRVKTDEFNYVYPDIVVTCEPKLVHDIFDTLENPQVIFEVTSKSTEFFDWERKRDLYVQIESLTDYLIVSQEKMLIAHFQRVAKKEWKLKLYEEPQEVITLDSIDCELTLEQIYRNIEFPVKLRIVKKKKS